jgi:uncharacterized caspase-like protein
MYWKKQLKFHLLRIVYIFTLILIFSNCREGLILIPPETNPYFAMKKEKNTQAQNTNARKFEKRIIQSRGSTIKKRDIKPEKIDKNIKGNYYGFLIGINNYRYWTKLKTPVNDIKVIKQILKKQYGFKIKTLTNQKATRNNIIDSLNNYRTILTSNDKFLIYYAGHGHFDKQTQKGYWIPVDAKTNSDTNWILSDTIITNIKRISAKAVLIVSDSCFSGTLTRSGHNQLNSHDTLDIYLSKMLERRSRILISSGGNEPVMDEGGSGHSVFANFFIKSLENQRVNIFASQDLFSNGLKECVAGSSGQVPEYQIIRNSGHAGGDFVFKKH